MYVQRSWWLAGLVCYDGSAMFYTPHTALNTKDLSLVTKRCNHQPRVATSFPSRVVLCRVTTADANLRGQHWDPMVLER